jgi:hypothetical protein
MNKEHVAGSLLVNTFEGFMTSVLEARTGSARLEIHISTADNPGRTPCTASYIVKMHIIYRFVNLL